MGSQKQIFLRVDDATYERLSAIAAASKLKVHRFATQAISIIADVEPEHGLKALHYIKANFSRKDLRAPRPKD
jgi:hypothetical protein